jgi:hypothetical protein
VTQITMPYQPHEKQSEIHSDPHRFKVVVCGRRFGKSTLALNHVLDKAIREPNGRYWIIAPTYGQAKSIYWREGVSKWIPREIIKKKNETELYIELINGSIIELKGADNEDGLRGAGLDGVVLDEYASMKSHVWSEIIRPTLVDKQGWAIFIGTPKGYNHFYDVYMETDDQYKSWRFTSHDNPTLPREELEALEREQKAKGEDVFYQEILAEFRKPSGAVYAEFDRTRQVRDDLLYSPMLPLYVAWDFGVRDPTSILWIQQSPGGEIYIVDEYEAADGNIEHFISVVRSKPYRVPEMHCGDPAGYQRELGTGLSVADALNRAGMYLRVRTGISKQTLIQTTHGVVQRLYVAPHCEKFTKSIENYHYPPIKEGSVRPTTEVPVHDWSSHFMDAISYFAVNEPTTQDTSEIPEHVPIFRKTGF